MGRQRSFLLLAGWEYAGAGHLPAGHRPAGRSTDAVAALRRTTLELTGDHIPRCNASFDRDFIPDLAA